MKDTNNYTLQVEYSEKKDRHTIQETWACRGRRALLKKLVDALDIPKDGRARAVVPDLRTVESLFGAENPGARREFARQKKGYAAFEKVEKNLDEGAYFFTVPVDAKLRVTVSAA